MNFKLHSSSYIKKTNNGCVLYNIINLKSLSLNSNEYLYLLEGSKNDNENDKNKIEFLEMLVKADFGFFTYDDIFVEQFRIGQHNSISSTVGKQTSLQILYLQIEDNCNINCSFCTKDNYSVKTTGCRQYCTIDKKIDLEKYKDIVDQSYLLGCREIHILGGDPTKELNSKKIQSLFKYILDTYNDINIIVYTNLFDKPPILNNIRISYIVYAIAHEQKTLDKIINSKKDINQFISNLRYINNSKTNYYILISVNEYNYTMINEMYSFFVELSRNKQVFVQPIMEAHDDKYLEFLKFSKDNKQLNPTSILNFSRGHSCLNNKITVFKDGSIGVCPMLYERDMENISKTTISEYIKNTAYSQYWEPKVYSDKCKECQHIFKCGDCIAIKKSNKKLGNEGLYCIRYC